MGQREGAESGAIVTNGEAGLTGGGPTGTSGHDSVRIRLIAFATFFVITVLQAVAISYSRIDDLRDAGQQVEGWRIAVDEGSSALAWLVCLLVIWQLVAWLRPPRVSWFAAVFLHTMATIPISLLHVGLMVTLREFAHLLSGTEYGFGDGDLIGALIYEYRKDVMSYIFITLFCTAVQWFAASRTEAPGGARPDTLEIASGSTVHLVPVAEIEWLESAGNYVTVHWQNRELLHRATLASLAEQLGEQRFARIHRSRIVRRDAVRKLETLQSGDFTLTLDSGTCLRGSRRYRDGLA
ncbi:MAG: LytTR family DNA-binding domain-containing protein [Altererythrobacter sp.]